MASLEDLMKECPQRSVACHRAAQLYAILMADPCFSRPSKITPAEREHLKRFIEKYGAPKCDLERLVRQALERLKAGLRAALGDDAIERAARYARMLHATGTTHRVAAAAGIVAAAREAGIHVPVRDAALALRCTEVAVREALRKLRSLLAVRR